MIKTVATYKTLQEGSFSPDSSHISCDICGSSNIIENPEGYVCRDCGIVLEIQKLKYDRPYNEDLIQYAKGAGRTQIGTSRERVASPYSAMYQRLNKYNSIVPVKETVINKAGVEISRIFSALSLEKYADIQKMVLDKFKLIRSRIKKGSKYRNTNKLVSITTYFCLKLRNVSINPYELVGVSGVTNKEFNDFILQVQRFLPEYGKRNRQEYILQRVLEVAEHFDLGMPFYYLSKKILYRLWDGIKNTSDNAVAGLISSISVLCSCRDRVSISAICKRIGVQMSTIQAQVKKKVFERFRVEGFISLIKSSNLLKKIVTKLGLLDCPAEEKEEVAEDGRVEIVFGDSVSIFNANDELDCYFFALRGPDRTAVVISVKPNDDPLDYKLEKSYKMYSDPLIEFDLYRYNTVKDPPPIGA